MKRRADTAQELSKAVASFWNVRERQKSLRATSGERDQGSRGSVTSGKQMDGFVEIIRKIVLASGLPVTAIHTETKLELPGYFRPEKKWDLAIIDQGALVAIVEFKSQVGPAFGNHFNNRTEESIGSAQDLWAAYRGGAFSITERPWLGYWMLLEDCPKSTAAVSVRQPHFSVFPEFVGSSYAGRYQLLMTKLIRERLYDAGCFLMSPKLGGAKGAFTEPNRELGFDSFVASLSTRLAGHVNRVRAGK